MNKSLIILAKYHKEWINIVKSFGEKDFQEDIVQEMYIRFTKYAKPDNVIINGKVNKSFIWIMLRNIYYDKIKFENRIETVNLEDVYNISYDEIDIDNILYNCKLLSKVDEVKNTIHWFDKGLLKLYFENDMSMRDIAKETKIGLTTIFQSINKSKKIIKKDIEEWQKENQEG